MYLYNKKINILCSSNVDTKKSLWHKNFENDDDNVTTYITYIIVFYYEY